MSKKIWCGTHTTFSYLILQEKNIGLSALHSYLIFNFYALYLMNYLLLKLLHIIFELNFHNLPECGSFLPLNDLFYFRDQTVENKRDTCDK